MRPLLIGPEQLARIATVKTYAEANIIPFGFRAVYGIEEQERGVLRHLSISVEGEDRWPNPVSVEALLQAFDMPPLEKCIYVWTEPLMGKERRNIVNVVAPLSRPDLSAPSPKPCSSY